MDVLGCRWGVAVYPAAAQLCGVRVASATAVAQPLFGLRTPELLGQPIWAIAVAEPSALHMEAHSIE